MALRELHPGRARRPGSLPRAVRAGCVDHLSGGASGAISCGERRGRRAAARFGTTVRPTRRRGSWSSSPRSTIPSSRPSWRGMAGGGWVARACVGSAGVDWFATGRATHRVAWSSRAGGTRSTPRIPRSTAAASFGPMAPRRERRSPTPTRRRSRWWRCARWPGCRARRAGGSDRRRSPVGSMRSSGRRRSRSRRTGRPWRARARI